MSIKAIKSALENRLATASLTPALPAVAWPNVEFARTVGTPYIKVDFRPILRRPVVIGPAPEQRVSGLFYLTVYVPEEKGEGGGLDVAEQLLTLFDGSTSFTHANQSVSIEYSEVKPPLHDTPFYAIPVEIGWYAYV